MFPMLLIWKPMPDNLFSREEFWWETDMSNISAAGGGGDCEAELDNWWGNEILHLT